MDNNFLNETNAEYASTMLKEVIDTGIRFKQQKEVRTESIKDIGIANLTQPMPENGMLLSDLIQEFSQIYLPKSYNFSSTNFMGFPDAGNSVAALAGSIMSDLLQQNLINQSFCSPAGTYMEISVIRWLREIVGYQNDDDVSNIFDVGGIITGGGTTSNTIALLLARENYQKHCMQDGVVIEDGHYLIVPKGIGHYSVKSAQMWIGCGNRLIEVETKDFKYDLDALEKTLLENKGKVMGLVAYAGDSRTMTVDHFTDIAKLVRSIDPNIWLHADACHGFSLGFSEALKHKLNGMESFDSITTDPHKVMNIPYTLSALLTNNPQAFRTIASLSDLIMQEQYAFGQITPFIGSKPWISLKLWFAMKNIGKQGYGNIIDARHAMAKSLQSKISNSSDFKMINNVEINAVVFMYTGDNTLSLTELNDLNRKIHEIMINEGIYHLHQFSIPDPGIWELNEILYPLRYMSGNPNIAESNLDEVLSYIRNLATRLTK